ncbi:MAG: peptide chain release factor N(5)-glutamine methyltransferase [Alphaproteobacteria bacterium]|nr:peptide chain release factor N(5)-glutamine methyltransferase [Alphaproteobacteria bacterium]
MLAGKTTVAGALAAATRTLSDAGVDAPAREARLLLAHVLGTAVEKLLGRNDSPLAGEAETRFAAGVARRQVREPLAQIIGRREFWSMMISVGPEVLTPRPDSEVLVEAALAALGAAGRRNTPLSLLDLGTGSGCLLIALLRELPSAKGLGVDASAAALARAQANAQSLGVAARCQFLCGDWTEPLGARFDVIVANPPYIASAAIAGLMPEVREHEPLMALDGGLDGLDAYRRLLPTIAERLAPRGALYLELGEGQGPAVIELAQASGLRLLARRNDLAGLERCLAFAAASGAS